MARFHEPVCPRVFGMGTYGEQVEQRIRQVARDAGLAVAAPKCAANVVAVVTPEPVEALASLRKRIPGLFNGVPKEDRIEAGDPAPVYVWHPAELRNEDGEPMRGGVMNVKSASILNEPTVLANVAAWMVLDGDAVVGRTLTQVADYMTMRLLAGARPLAEPTGIDTILRLLDDDLAPRSVTLGDRAFLQALYATRSNRRAVLQRAEIARQMGKAPAERRRPRSR